MKQFLFLVALTLVCGYCYAQGFIDHIVQRGETLEFLATKFGVSEQDIRDQNEDFDLDILYVGLPLQIPISENIDNAEQLITLQSSTNSVLNEANNYYQSGKYRKAIKLYSKTIKENPKADLYYLRGRSYLSQGKYKSAIRDLESAQTDNTLSMAFQSDCELLLADAQAKREIQLAERTEILGSLFSLAAATTVSVLSAKSASNTSNSSVSAGGVASSSNSSYETTSGSSATLSTSTQPQKDNSIQCPSCNGIKHCTQCRGTGFRTDNLFGTGQDPTNKCGICGGSGDCPKCHGTGRISK